MEELYKRKYEIVERMKVIFDNPNIKDFGISAYNIQQELKFINGIIKNVVESGIVCEDIEMEMLKLIGEYDMEKTIESWK